MASNDMTVLTVPTDDTATLMALPTAPLWTALHKGLLRATGVFVTGVENEAVAEAPAELLDEATFAAVYADPEMIDRVGYTRGPHGEVQLNGAYNEAFGAAAGGCGMIFEVPKHATITFNGDKTGARVSARHAAATYSYPVGGCLEYTSVVSVGPNEDPMLMRVTAWCREAYLVITWKVCPKTGARTVEPGEIVLICGFVSQTESTFKVRI
jgi:hypothetical protein